MNLSSDELNTELQIIYERCARLFYFAVTNDLIAHDVFVCGINRMIDEEKFLSRDPNSLLLDGLEQFKSSYEKQMNDLKTMKPPLKVSDVYDLMKQLNDISTVQLQVNTIKIYQRVLLLKYQHDVTSVAFKADY